MNLHSSVDHLEACRARSERLAAAQQDLDDQRAKVSLWPQSEILLQTPLVAPHSALDSLTQTFIHLAPTRKRRRRLLGR